MKLRCEVCNKEAFGTVTLLKEMWMWYGKCPECGREICVMLPKSKIFMAFTDPVPGYEDMTDKYSANGKYRYFTDNFTGQGIHTFYGFDTPQKFIMKWKEIYDKPNGMWYWVVADGRCICSGACDPADIQIFKDYFGVAVHI